jgi:MFS family permease
VLALVSAVSFFEMYDLYLFALNLKQIQASLGIAEEDLGTLGAVVRAGAVLAIFIAPIADRWGRRRVLLGTVVAYTALTGATALSPNVEAFVVLQFLARGFAVAETLLAAVVIVEEFSAEHRGWGIGALAALQACGAGFAALMFGFVDVLPFGWRALYLVGLIPLALITYWRRTLPETDRFEALAESRAASTARPPVLSNIVLLAREHPGYFWVLMGTIFLIATAGNAAGFFAPKYLQDVHAWSPASVAALNFFGGALAIIGNPLAGWLSDRFGRRPIGALFSFGYALTLIAFYASIGLFIPVLWVLYVFFSMGTGVTLSAYGAELFPTAKRSTATGARGLADTLGAIAGLSAVSALFGILGSNWSAIMVVAGIGFLVPIAILALFPETARRTLEEISGEVKATGKSP